MKVGPHPTKKMMALPKALEKHNYSLGKAMKEVGYADSVCRVPSLVKRMAGYQKTMEPVLKRFEEKRDKALAGITDAKIEEADAKSLADIADKMQRNIQLLSGKPTESVNHFVTKTDDELRAIAEGTGSEGAGKT